MAKLLERATVQGRPVASAGGSIVPLSRRWHLRLPGDRGGLIWNRPLALRVRDADGGERYHPIIDWTRIAQVGLLAAGLAMAAVFWRAGVSDAERDMEEPA